MLADTFFSILGDWSTAFKRRRTHVRAMEQSVSGLCSLGRRTITRAIQLLGRDQQDWTAVYKLFSRSPWHPSSLFDAILRRAIPLCTGLYIVFAFDDTTLHKVGKKIPGATWHRDPLSPPWRVNLRWSLRYLHACLIVPEHQRGGSGARALPVLFAAAPSARKPGRRASQAQLDAYKKEARQHRLPTLFVKELLDLRRRLDACGGAERAMLVCVDGSFCNGLCMSADVEHTVLVGRTRRDARLTRPAPLGSGRVYAADRFTPEQVRQDPDIPWRWARIHYGGKLRQVRYKVVRNVLWPGATKRRPLQLIVVAPMPYGRGKSGHLYYRQPAYLLCTDPNASAPDLLQGYFDRWQIEVSHREQKDIIGVGQAQVWSANSVPRQPAMMVAAYSALHLAGLLTYGPGRPTDANPLPRWRANAPRPSILDLITILRREMGDERPLPGGQTLHFNAQWAVATAAT